ncbi:uncharacterized protein EAF02_006104 [Botrytis sinoallii]|uniref:uncharacterized protein n=1 Tax=Botrytis sinoallii TaxID=1463999 RepID=UPI001900C28F|nr:uncharacterized protein EAF02_006104 [Botrytis sinoallii]KAF7882741.1 hypothetical protein EAF02_006104 [Botrytis sinoallii]
MAENQNEDASPEWMDLDSLLARQLFAPDLSQDYNLSLFFSPPNLPTNHTSPAQHSFIPIPRINPPFIYRRQKPPILKRTLTTQNNPMLPRPSTRRSYSTENPVAPALFYPAASQENASEGDILQLSPMMQYLHRDRLDEFEKIVNAIEEVDVRRRFVQMGNHPQRGIEFREFVVRGLGVGREGVEVRRFGFEEGVWRVWRVDFWMGEKGDGIGGVE